MNTYKVIKIDKHIIYLGKDDGSLLKLEKNSFEFTPKIGDMVNVYLADDDTYIVILKEQEEIDTQNKKTYWTDDRIKSMAWAGIVSVILLHPFFGVIPAIMQNLLKQRGDEVGAKYIQIGLAVSISLAILFRFFLMSFLSGDY